MVVPGVGHDPRGGDAVVRLHRWLVSGVGLTLLQSVHLRQIQLAECFLARRCRLAIHVAALQTERTVVNDLSSCG